MWRTRMDRDHSRSQKGTMMSLPNEVQSMIEDLFEEEMDRLLALGVDIEKAGLLAEQRAWERMDND